MSLEHKAFVFDFYRFRGELKPILESSLRSGDTHSLFEFIVANKDILVDPYQGEALDESWEDMIEERDAHQYGDFALTKYYSPLEDQGLGVEWEGLQELMPHSANVSFSPFLGAPIVVGEEIFDPGKMGAYFQSESEVVESLSVLTAFESVVPKNYIDGFVRFKCLLERAIDEGRGIYITF
ncbi:hypothetical protein [Pseudomonas sp. URMO17WK12:I2]|uniref:hypothetical protein n=1 Tax=Pseudomonas sp. URMO17WK12:I2 TaxID=1261623 RepID=UPI0011B85B96|nr:hypothetical protein [Pseudomonas sp. URMO17WK12:I2]